MKWLVASAGVAAALIGHAFVFIVDNSGCVSTWPAGSIPMQVKLATTPTLTDGTNFRSSVLAAMTDWNPHIDTVQLAGTGSTPGSYEIGNGVSEIVMDSDIGNAPDSVPFDDYTLAVTIPLTDSNTVTEADIIFNTAYTWDSFRGGQIGEKQDIRRVAAHELGHVLGLGHPDEAPQDAIALMNSIISYAPSIEGPIADDIAGAQAIYGSPGFAPGNDIFSNATEFFHSFGTEESMYGTNVSATKERGEPDLDPDDPGGKTVWWKWKATATGTLTLTTLGSNLDTLLAAYTGSSVDSLTEIALNDDVDPGVVRSSTVTFNVVYGNTYYFAVDGWHGFVGLIKLNFSLVADPGASPPLITSPPCTRNYYEGMGATIECGVSNATGVTYVWKRNGQVLTNQTSSLLVIWGLTLADSGHYEVVATNSIGSTVSQFDIIVSPADLGIVAFGDATNGQGTLPQLMGGITSIDAAAKYSLGVTAGGTLRVWGATPLGSEADTFNSAFSVAGAAAPDHFLGLTRDGYIAGFGPYPAPIVAPGRTRWTPPAGLGKAIAIDTGVDRSVALLSNGSVISWDEARVIPSPNGLHDVIAVAAGGRHFLALKKDGSVVGWGDSQGGATTPPMDLSGVIEIAAGGDEQNGHSLALKSDGTVVAWGSDSSGQSTVPQGLTGVVDIAAGPNFSLALKADGTVVGWGDGSKGQFDFPTTSGTPFKLAAGTDFSLALVRATGPIITVQPVDVTVMEGETATFSVSVLGTPTISYGWRRYGGVVVNGGRISGAGGRTLQITNAQLGDAGSYNVEVSNQKGHVTSVNAKLTVIRPHSITERPTSQTVNEGSDLSVSVGVAAGGTYTFEWRHNRTKIPGATNATLDIHGATTADAGYYEALVTNEMGVVTSTVFYINVTVADAGIAVWGNVASAQPPQITGPLSAADVEGANIVLKGDGTVVAWGRNDSGQADVPFGIDGVVAVSSAVGHTNVLKADGTVLSWGGTWQGESSPPEGLDGVVAISGGSTSNIALKSDGTVVTWGSGSESRLSSPRVPVPAGLKDVVAVQAAYSGYYAVRSDGSVVSWGGPEFYEAPTIELADVVSIDSTAGHAIALKRDGSVVEWGFPQLDAPAITDAKTVATGGTYSVVLRSDAKLTAWEAPNSYGQEAIPVGLSNVVSVSAGYDSAMALYRAMPPSITFAQGTRTVVAGDYVRIESTVEGSLPLSFVWKRDGMIIGDGNGISGSASSTIVIDPASAELAGTYRLEVTNSKGTTVSEPVVITVKVPPTFVHRPLTRIVKAGGAVTFDATAADVGTVTYAWKRNGATIPGATGPVFSIPTVTYADGGIYEVTATGVEASNWSTFSLTVSPADTSVLVVGTWGTDIFHDVPNVPPDIGSVVSLTAGIYGAMALRDDGTLDAWGNSSLFSPGNPNPPHDVVAVGIGDYHAVALLADGTILQRQSSSNRPKAPPAGLRRVVQIACRGDGNLALKSDGTVVAWGVNQPPDGLSGVVEVTLGTGTAYALKSDGTVVGWPTGGGQYYEVTGSLTGVTAISAGSDHAMALKTDGTVVCWGDNLLGKADVPANLGGVVAISAGAYHSVALKDDGKAVRWGSNYENQEDSRPDLEPIAMVSAGYYYNVVLTPRLLPPTFTDQPESVTVRQLSWFRLYGSATGRPTPTFQWQKDGVDIPGATGVALEFSAANPEDSGTYRLVATNSAGTVVSNEAQVTVQIPVAQPQFNPPEGAYPAGQTVAISSETEGATIRYVLGGGTVSQDSGTIYTGPITLADSTLLYAIAYKDGMAVSNITSGYYEVTPNHVPKYLPPSVPRAIVGVPFQLQLSGSGGDGALHWSVVSGSPPAGLSFSSSGLLSGTPTANGTSNFTVRVFDSDAVVAAFDEDTGAVVVTVDATDSVPAVATTALPDAGLSIAYAQSLSASGGNGQLTWGLASGTLPPGMTLSQGGVISGVPGTLGTYHFTVKVADDDTVTGAPDEGSKALSITVVPSPRLVNVSMRALAGSGDNTLIVGFSIVGTGTKTVVIRGVGPKLVEYGVPVVVADPAIRLFRGNDVMTENDDWDASLAQDFAVVGAFPLDVGSKDAALKVELAAGGYTIHLLNPGGVAEALVEVYDESHNASSRLVNVSSRLKLASGKTAILGTAVTGGPIYMLARNVGPGISQWLTHPEDALADPYLKLFAGSNLVEQNDDWDISLAPFFVSSGAFALTEGSKDAAIRAQFQIGGYTVHATGTDGTGGVTIIEIYESR